MFERFTERARQVVALSQDAARRLRHNHIGTDHILLGLIREEEGLAARVLMELGYSDQELLKLVDQGTQTVSTPQIPFTINARKVFELALREALSLGHNYIGTEHILLGLVRDEHVVKQFNFDPEEIRNAVIAHLSGPAGQNEKKRVEREKLWTPHKTEEESSSSDSQSDSESDPEKVRATITYGNLTLTIEGDTSGLSSSAISDLLGYASRIFKK